MTRKLRTVEALMTEEAARIDELVNRVKQLKRLGQPDEAEIVLLAEVQRWEADGTGVAPWYYEQLAVIYRKQGHIDDEIAILERFEGQPKLPGAGPEILRQRL